MKDLSLHIMDIVQNSTRAKATLVQIIVNEQINGDILSIEIIDNGCGMDAETLSKVSNPFFTSRTTRKVGLGIPLIMQNTEQTGGYVKITSKKGQGTTLKAIFGHTHIDRPPWGDLAGTIALLVCGHPDVNFIYLHKRENQKFYFDSREIKTELEDIPVTNPKVFKFIVNMIQKNLLEIGVDINVSSTKR
jgi:hypothetical protein